MGVVITTAGKGRGLSRADCDGFERTDSVRLSVLPATDITCANLDLKPERAFIPNINLDVYLWTRRGLLAVIVPFNAAEICGFNFETGDDTR